MTKLDVSQSGRPSQHGPGRSLGEVAGLKKIHVASLRNELQRARRSSSSSLSSFMTVSRKNSMQVKVGEVNGKASHLQQPLPSVPTTPGAANPSGMENSTTLESAHLNSVSALDEPVLPHGLNGQLEQIKDLPTSAQPRPRRENWWSKAMVLSLDSGGARGFQILIVLEQLMEEIRIREGLNVVPKPCLYFDYIVGAGTGGLIAILLGRLRMSVAECIQSFKQLSVDAFCPPQNRSLARSRQRHDSEVLHEWIAGIVNKHAPAALQRGQEDIFASDPVQCKTAVVSFDIKTGKPIMLRTYGLQPDLIQNGPDVGKKILWTIKPETPVPGYELQTESNDIQARLLRIADAARATSASPVPVKGFNLFEQQYSDAGLGANNPSLLMYSELKDLRMENIRVEPIYRSKASPSPRSTTSRLRAEQGQEKKASPRSISSSPPGESPFIDTFVSIGLSREGSTKIREGEDSAKSILRHGSDIGSKLQTLLGRDSISSHETENFFALNEDIQHFHRLITDSAIADVKFEDWRQSTGQILRERRPTSKKLHNSVELLVRTKRGRERTSRWTAFAGPLCYSLEQLSAESVHSLSRESLGLSAPSYLRPGNLSPYEQQRATTNALYGRLIQNFSIEEKLTKQPFRGISKNSCLFLWRVPEFYDALASRESDKCFYNIVTVNRIHGDRYWAGTCISFAEMCWPTFGISVLKIARKICETLRENGSFQEENIDCGGLKIGARATRELLVIEHGDGEVSEMRDRLLECVRWLICALMPNDDKDGIFRTNMTPLSFPVDNTTSIFRDVKVDDPDTTLPLYVLVFKAFEPCSKSDYYCWTNMFTYVCVIDLNFRIDKVSASIEDVACKSEADPPGLCMNYELMLELAGIDGSVEYEEGQVLIGRDTALVPLVEGRWPHKSRWHLWRTKGDRIKLDGLKMGTERDKIKPKDLEGFKRTKVYVGWTVEAEVLLGTSFDAASTALVGTRIQTVNRVIERAQDSLAFQGMLHMASLGLAFQGQRVYNYQQTTVPAARLNQFELWINDSQDRQVIIYDDKYQHASLVPEIALLIFSSFHYIKHHQYNYISREEDYTKWEPIETLEAPLKNYDIGTECSQFLVSNRECQLSKDNKGTAAVKFKIIVEAVKDLIDRGTAACRTGISRGRRNDAKALYGFDLREAICNEDIHLRRLKCTTSMRAWAAAAEGVDIYFVNDIGALTLPSSSSRQPDCISTYPGLLSGTVLSLHKAFSRNMPEWNANVQYRRIGVTNQHWIFTGQPFNHCCHCNNSHHHPSATTCGDCRRVQHMRKNSKFRAVFHHRDGFMSNLNPVPKVWALKKEGIWSKNLWENQPGNSLLEQKGAVRFGKVKPGTQPIQFRIHGEPAPPEATVAPASRGQAHAHAPAGNSAGGHLQSLRDSASSSKALTNNASSSTSLDGKVHATPPVYVPIEPVADVIAVLS